MLENFIISRILGELPFVANAQQQALTQQLARFLINREERPCFVLKGYAGTGKSSIMGALVRAAAALQQAVVLLAPTGRAAKVLNRYAGQNAYTIHKYIYRKENNTEFFQLGWNKDKDTLYIVDEASMIGADRENSAFGSGSLLDDLMRFVFQDSHNGNKLMLVGDDAQLPPVGHSVSPALDVDFLSGYGLTLSQMQLTQVARQAEESGILNNATNLREALNTNPVYPYSPEMVQESDDVKFLNSNEIVEEIERSYQQSGLEEVIIITRSNWRTNMYNQGIRSRLLWHENQLETGDRLMASRNNYFWTEKYEDLPFLANGDLFVVERIWHEHEMYGYHFAEVSLRSADYDWEIDLMVWLDTLTTDTPEKSYLMQKDLYAKIAEDYPEIRNKKELREKIMSSPYYNALQVRYAYAVTCHKAQGGQWKNVFIDAGPTLAGQEQEEDPKDKLRWMYTAMTRAMEKVYLLRYPNT